MKIKNSMKHMMLFMVVLSLANATTAQKDKTYLIPAKIIENVSTNINYSQETRKFTGIPSMTVCENGHLWSTWYAGKTPGEDCNNYVVVANSKDKGFSWKEIFVIDPDQDGPVRAFDPQLWIDPEGTLWLFWGQGIKKVPETAHVWAITIKQKKNSLRLSDPFCLSEGVMMNKPSILSTGEWVLPISFWGKQNNSCGMIISNDSGKTWTLRGAASVPGEDRSADEHQIIERRDGSLWMLIRTRYGIGESFSLDKGITWSPLIPSKIKHTESRFFITRLKSGNLLLVKHKEINEEPILIPGFSGRSHLMAFISKDDGESWSRGLLLDERPGVSYPDGQQLEDGRIILTYDYNRTKEQLIMMTSFTEDDILSSDYDTKIIEVFNHRKIITDGGEIDQ